MWVFKQKDESGEGNLRMDDIREAYTEYCGGLVEKNDIDAILSKCSIQVNKGGKVRYQQFIQVHLKKLLDTHKVKIRSCFAAFDEMR